MDHYNVIHKYYAIQHVMAPDLIKTAFCKTGIYPHNPNVFMDEDYAPSMASSTSAHVPESYPDDVPNSPGLAVGSDLDTSDDDYVERDDSVGESENAGMEIEPEDEGGQADSRTRTTHQLASPLQGGTLDFHFNK
jgi:hypothetical protein